MTNRYIFDARISERKLKELLNMILVGRSGADVEQTGGGSTARPANGSMSARGAERWTWRRSKRGPLSVKSRLTSFIFGPRRGRGAGGKTPVIGLLKRGGKVFTGVVKNCS